METFRFQPGETPVLLSIPHVGTAIPPDIAATMTDEALAVPDTDWHLDRLYHFAPALGIGFLKATCSRYVIDLNRGPQEAPLYPGTDNSELCPTYTFDRHPVYKPGMEPDATEIERRTGAFWTPYHEQLQAELQSLTARFGVAVLLDVHSIPSRMPHHFDERLPDFSLGSGEGSAAAGLVNRVMCALEATDQYSSALDNHFKGGFITHRHGRPTDNIHAFQLKVTRRTYMEEEAPFQYRNDLAGKIRPSLERILAATVEWAWGQAATRR